MQSLDDDMDELFKRAGEEYPLNTNNADWNKVLHGLHHSNEDLPQKEKKDYRYLLLLLLLPIGFICGRDSSRNNQEIVAKNSTEATTTKTLPQAENRTGIRPVENEKVKSGIKKLVTEKKTEVNSNSSNKKYSSENLDNNNSNGKKRDELLVQEAGKKTSSSHAGIRSGRTIKSVSSSTKSQNISQKNQAVNKPILATKDLANTAGSDTANNTENANKFNNSISGGQKALDNKEAIVSKDTVISHQTTEATDIQKGTADKAPEITKTLKTTAPPFKKRLFYSLVIGPDLSSEKFYKMSKVGYSIGATLGYQFSKRFTIEAGALWDRKNYYTSGSYFDTSKLHLPEHSMLTKANGYCDMIEVPVNIKYSIVTKSNYSWFLSAGLSSYFMQKEDYDITYKRYNQTYLKDYQYKNASKNLFSILNISVGYQTTLGRLPV